MGSQIPIIDSHIHLFPASALSTLAWQTPDGPLHKQQSLDEFKAATSTADATLQGYIFIEADRKSSASPSESEGDGDVGWAEPLAEVEFIRRLATGQLLPDEGGHHPDAAAAPRLLAAVPWAPVPAGPEALERYLERAKAAAGGEHGETWAKVRGFRYLLQDKPSGTALQDRFVAGLRLLGRRGFAFDVGVDQHRRGRLQLEEVVEMIDRAHEGVADEEEKVVFVLNHMCKPDLEIYNVQTSPAFIAWRTAMFTLSRCSRTYVKLSGGLTEMGESLRRRSVADIFDAISPWLSVLLAAFGPGRIMFGSDWPVCTVGFGAGAGAGAGVGKTGAAAEGAAKNEKEGEGEGGEAAADGESTEEAEAENAWEKWRLVVDRVCYMMSYGEEEQRLIWGGTALKAYGIKVSE